MDGSLPLCLPCLPCLPLSPFICAQTGFVWTGSCSLVSLCLPLSPFICASGLGSVVSLHLSPGATRSPGRMLASVRPVCALIRFPVLQIAGPHARQCAHLLVSKYVPSFVSWCCKIAGPHARQCAYLLVSQHVTSMCLHLLSSAARLPGYTLASVLPDRWAAFMLVSQYLLAFVSRFWVAAACAADVRDVSAVQAAAQLAEPRRLRRKLATQGRGAVPAAASEDANLATALRRARYSPARLSLLGAEERDGRLAVLALEVRRTTLSLWRDRAWASPVPPSQRLCPLVKTSFPLSWRRRPARAVVPLMVRRLWRMSCPTRAGRLRRAACRRVAKCHPRRMASVRGGRISVFTVKTQELSLLAHKCFHCWRAQVFLVGAQV